MKLEQVPEPSTLVQLPSSQTIRWRVGTIVVTRGMEDEPSSHRLVIGHKPNGHCMTVYVTPPPWLAGREPQVLVDPPYRLCEPCQRSAPLPPAPAPALSSSADEDEWIRSWLEGLPLPDGREQTPSQRFRRRDERGPGGEWEER